MANPGVKGCGPTSRHFQCQAIGTGDAGAGGSTGWEEKRKRESGLLAGPYSSLNKYDSAWSVCAKPCWPASCAPVPPTGQSAMDD